jgi:hypothetical protein
MHTKPFYMDLLKKSTHCSPAAVWGRRQEVSTFGSIVRGAKTGGFPVILAEKKGRGSRGVDLAESRGLFAVIGWAECLYGAPAV